ncbi:hypothetical protein MVEN_01962100 [Mycena venus]|uniref:Uncharacterized protein n=1 Tax=Mycena venus TaxID=2733690 RepID=A0A8H7CLJ5_9AGAR|nr:hypothetical protein MVEN_01962100 [Mycena venus]
MPPTALLSAGGGRRILRSTPSMSSLASFLSSLSLYTTTSSKTQWGPGALAGRAILALGKAAIRGAELVVIVKRMAIIQDHLPYSDERPDGGDTSESFMDRIFDDLLELSRPELYPDGIRIAAMELILAQIASGHTSYLYNCLSKWLLDDLRVLLAEIISVSMFCGCGFMEPRLTNAYLSALPEDRHPLVPCIVFIADLARQNETTFEAALLSKFLDVVLLTASRKDTILDRDFELENQSLARAFALLSSPPLELQEFWNMALEQYWPFDYPPSLEDVVRHISATSPTTWYILEAHFLQHEAPNMLRLVTPVKHRLDNGRSAADVAYPQLKDFNLPSGNFPIRIQDALDSGLAASCALWHLIRCVALGGDVHGLMAEHLSSLFHKHKTSMFSRIIYWLIPNTREARSKEMRDLCTLVGGRPRLNSVLMHFLLDLGHSDEWSKYALIDAVIVLIVPLLVPELKSWAIHEDVFRRSHFFPSLRLRPSYSKETLRLFSIIRENTLASVIGEPGSQSSQQIADVLEPLFNG